MMFKVLILQALYNLADDAMEYMLRDRLSFMRFLGFGITDKIPDAKTIWKYREQLTKAEQKYQDARWTQKGNQSFFGYKDHINADVEHKIIRYYEVTPANTHDSQLFKDIVSVPEIGEEGACSADAMKSLCGQRVLFRADKVVFGESWIRGQYMQ